MLIFDCNGYVHKWWFKRVFLFIHRPLVSPLPLFQKNHKNSIEVQTDQELQAKIYNNLEQIRPSAEKRPTYRFQKVCQEICSAFGSRFKQPIAQNCYTVQIMADQALFQRCRTVFWDSD